MIQLRTHTPARTHTFQTIVSAPLSFFLHFLLSCNSLVLLCLERVPVLPQAMINVIGAVFLFLLVRSWLAVGELWHKGNTDSLCPPPHNTRTLPAADCFWILQGKGLISGVLISPRAGPTQPTGDCADRACLSARTRKHLHTLISNAHPFSPAERC